MKSQAFGWKPVLRYLLVVFMLLGANLYGATHTVSTEGELVAAVTAVNSSGTDDNITFTANIVLNSVLANINKASGSLTIDGNGHTLSRNSSASAFGVLFIESGTVTIDRLTISGSSFEVGVYNSQGTLTLTNCTVSGNTGGKYGGGVLNSGIMTISSCTVSNNTAIFSGGGIRNVGTLTLIRSIVSGNSAQNGSEIFSPDTITADASNVFGHSGLTTAQAFYDFTPGATDVTCTSDGTNAAALVSILSPLAHNGGPTQTHALVVGSPAIDIASTGPANDQRGISRPQGSGFDAGAYEFVRPVDPTDPDPEPILEWSYSHSLVSNTAKLNAWVLDPDARLGVGANWIMEGDLSRGFRFVDGMLVGMFDTTGIHTFRISGIDGTITVNHTFTVQVMAPTVCPTIFGAWINGDYLSIEVLEDARHGVAAQTAPMQMTLERGQATDIRFDWDYIKDGFSFRLIDGDLPPGLVLDGQSGVISGVPSASASYRFLVSVKDWRGRGYQWVEVNIP